MKSINIMIKPASSSCNLRCRYCFYIDETKNRSFVSHGVMNAETIEILCMRIDEALEHNGRANIAFQGGEPTVAGLDWFRAFTSSLDKYPGIDVHYSLQTNGTLIDEEFADFLKEHHFLVGISLDGYQANMDYFRYDIRGKGVFYKVLGCAELLEKKGVEYNIITVVTRQLAEHASGLYSFYKSHHMNYVQLIPCMPPMEETDEISMTPSAYRKFYKEFFSCWFKDLRKGKYMSVNLFDNLMEMLSGNPPYQCGMLGKCTVQYVIESNGDVYPCDFFCLDEYSLGNIKDASLAAMADSDAAASFRDTSGCTKTPCASCRFRNICSGGCRRQNVCYLSDTDCAYRDVLEEILPELDYALKQMSRR